jgi:arylsulfatase A-like enzyme
LLNDPWLHGTRLPEPVKISGYQSDVLCSRAVEWLSGRGDPRARASAGDRVNEPWFCMVSLEAPHPPYDAPAGDAQRLNPADLVLPANIPRGGEVEVKARREIAGYYAHIQATDTAIGAMLDALRAVDPKAFDNTLIVFTSVHGDMHGAHGLFRKGWPHEEAIRVPLLMRFPGRKGEARSDAVSLADLPRMLVSLVERGTLDTSGAEAAVISMPSVVALPHQCDRVWRGVRTPKRKLVLNADDSPWLFFDLESDPGERQNLVEDARRGGEMAELRQKLNRTNSR